MVVPPPGASSGAEHRAHLVAGLASLLAASLVILPLLLRLSSHTMGEKFLRSFYLYRHIATHGPGQWMTATYDGVYFPDGGTGVTNGVPLYVLGGALRHLVGELAGVNLAILLHLALGIYATWRLSRRVWEGVRVSDTAHFVGAVGFGLGCHAVSVFANGQPENLGLGYFALAAEGALGFMRGGRPGALLGGLLAYSLAFAMTPYLPMALLLAGGPPLLLALEGRAALRRAAILLVGLGLISGAYSLHFAKTVAGEEDRLFCPAELASEPDPARVLVLGGKGGMLVASPLGPEMNVLDPAFLLRPPVLDGGPHRKHLHYNGYLGGTLVVLALLGLKRRKARSRPLLLAGLLPLVLGMGPFLELHGWIPVIDGAPLPLPLGLLRMLPGIGPVFDTIQVPSRLVPGLTLPLALLAAAGAARLGPVLGQGRALLIALPLVEQLLLFPVRWDQLRSHDIDEAHQALAQQPDRLAVVDVPPVGFEQGLRDGPMAPRGPPPVELVSRMVRDSIRHHHPVPFKVGCFDALTHPALAETGLPRALARIALAPEQAPEAAAALLRPVIPRLHAAGYGWLALHPGTSSASPEQVEALRRAADATFERVALGADGSALYRVPRGGPSP